MSLRSLLFLGFFSVNLFAHQTGLSYVEIKESLDHKISVVYKKPLSDKKGKDIRIKYPEGCLKKEIQKQEIVNGFIINRYQLWCQGEGLKSKRIWIDGLNSQDRGILIYYEKESFKSSSLVRSRTPFMHIDTKTTTAEFFVEYVELGLFHIAGGYDHLLFVLALFLLARSIKQLLYAITAFTLSHSITLAFGIFGVISVGVAYIEAMIALSIVFLARELVSSRNSLTKNYLGVIAFIFGLLHGFGFSSALKNIGLAADAIPLSLFSFNVGIELGQILFISCLSAIAYFTRGFSRYVSVEKFKRVVAYFIGSLSSMWLIERIAGF